MDTRVATSFMERLATDEAFQKRAAAAVEGKSGREATAALVRLSSTEGIPISAEALLSVRGAMLAVDELSEEALAGVAGGTRPLEALDTDVLNSVGEDAQLANVDLQNVLQKQQQTLQMMSNISKALHDTAMSVIRKIG